jgi:ribosomal protein L37E
MPLIDPFSQAPKYADLCPKCGMPGQWRPDYREAGEEDALWDANEKEFLFEWLEWRCATCGYGRITKVKP